LVAGGGIDNATVHFPDAGTFTVRVTVSDNGSSVSHEWTVTAVEVPDGLITIASPDGPGIVRVEEGATLPLRASVDANLTAVALEWFVNGVLVATTASHDLPITASGTYAIRLRANATYLGAIAYSADDAVDATVVVVVAPGPGNGNNTNNTNNTNPPPAPPQSTWDGLPLVLVLVAVAVAGSYIYLRWRKGRGRDGGSDPPA
jgi:hypothetical protein